MWAQVHLGRDADTHDSHLLARSLPERLRPAHFPRITLHPTGNVRPLVYSGKYSKSYLKFLLHLERESSEDEDGHGARNMYFELQNRKTFASFRTNALPGWT